MYYVLLYETNPNYKKPFLCKTAHDALALYLEFCVTKDEREYYYNLTGLEFENIQDEETIEALFRNVFEHAVLYKRV